MLETEEVDQDYFTPAASTSLANIFESTSKPNEESGNSLKYTPPKPQAPKSSSHEDKLGLQPIFRCSLVGHQWVNNIYSAKGKIGCSILKVTKDPHREGALIIVLYDSNKHTLSSISLSNKLQVTVKQMNFISFYESYQTFWSLNGSEEDIRKILEYCTSKNVQLKFSEEQVTGPPESLDKGKNDKIECETEGEDTGSIKTKASLLSRMANMGKPVLPHPPASNDDTSGSSSSDEDINNIKKHSQTDGAVKRNFSELKNSSKKKNTKSDSVRKVAPIIKQTYEESTQNSDELLIMLQNTKTGSNSVTNSVDLFITEQRINNSELRININRVNDKVDKLLTKVNDFENKNTNESNNVNTEILLKLLKEYESKNKMYEELLKQKANIGTSSESEISAPTSLLAIENESYLLNTKIMELETIIKQKDTDILLLNNKIEKLKHDNELQYSKAEKDELLKKITDIDQCSLSNFELLTKLTEQKEQFSVRNNDVLTNQIKSIMNDTFHGIVDKFEETKEYSGEEIRNIVEKVIKRVTMVSLKNLKAE